MAGKKNGKARFKKANNRKITKGFLKTRADHSISRGYPKQKWIIFCEELLGLGFDLTLYEARQTWSKYVRVSRKGDDRIFKVRFSNHRPNKRREAENDCDFFVGVNNFGTTTTEDALLAVRDFFAGKGAA